MKNNKFEIFYSIAIIVSIPALLIANTVFLAVNTRQDYVSEIRRKADVINQSIAISAEQYIANGNSDALKKYIDTFVKEAPSVSEVYIAKFENDTAKILASSSDTQELKTYQLQHIKFAKDTDRPVARRADATDANGNKTTVWEVATPIKNSNGELLGIAVTAVLTADADELIDNTYFKSYIFLAISVAIVMALLIHHYRVASYSKLLVKQKEINQTMSDFLSVATHELKAPTTIIKGYISNVLDGMTGDVNDATKDQLTVALTQTDRLNNLVQDLLNVSRVEQGRVQYNISTVDPVEIIQTITNNYTSIATEKNLKLQYDNSNAATIVADAGRVQEIFTNLIDNAVKYTPSGVITVTHRIEKQFLVTSVRDTGNGISAENRERLFQRFYRVQSEETKGISGTGLGLWIIKQYIEHMGGKIEVDSLVGSGTEFIVYLPLSKGTNA